jgi:hypothetical protein
MMLLKWFMVSPYDEHAQKLVTRWLSIRNNWLLVGRAFTKIGHSLAEQTQKLDTHSLNIRKNWLLVG